MKQSIPTPFGGRPNGRWRTVLFTALLFVFGFSTGAVAQDFLPSSEAKTLVSQEARTVMTDIDQAHKSGDAQQVAIAYAKRNFLATTMNGLDAGLSTVDAYQQAVAAIDGPTAGGSSSAGFSLQAMGSAGPNGTVALSEGSKNALQAEMFDLLTN